VPKVSLRVDNVHESAPLQQLRQLGDIRRDPPRPIQRCMPMPAISPMRGCTVDGRTGG
jgi:hypothetical protein